MTSSQPVFRVWLLVYQSGVWNCHLVRLSVCLSLWLSFCLTFWHLAGCESQCKAFFWFHPDLLVGVYHIFHLPRDLISPNPCSATFVCLSNCFICRNNFCPPIPSPLCHPSTLPFGILRHSVIHVLFYLHYFFIDIYHFVTLISFVPHSFLFHSLCYVCISSFFIFIFVLRRLSNCHWRWVFLFHCV